MEPIRIQIPKELFEPAHMQHYEGQAHVNLLKLGPDVITFAHPISWQVDITNTGDALLVVGTAEGEGVTSCARCLEEVSLPLTGDIEGSFIIDASTVDPEELEEDDVELLPDDKTIDLAPLIEGALLLDIPRIPLCSEDCKGICPICGADRNKDDCDCEHNAASLGDESNPFAALKDYHFN